MKLRSSLLPLVLAARGQPLDFFPGTVASCGLYFLTPFSDRRCRPLPHRMRYALHRTSTYSTITLVEEKGRVHSGAAMRRQTLQNPFQVSGSFMDR